MVYNLKVSKDYFNLLYWCQYFFISPIEQTTVKNSEAYNSTSRGLRFETLHRKLHHHIDIVNCHVDIVNRRVDIVNRRVDIVNRRVDIVNRRVDIVNRCVDIVNRCVDIVNCRVDVVTWQSAHGATNRASVCMPPGLHPLRHSNYLLAIIVSW